MRHLPTIIVLTLLTTGCHGSLQLDGEHEDAPIIGDNPSADNPRSDDPSQPDSQQAPEPERAAFALPREQLRLLPYSVRLRKLQILTGLSADDPAFDGLDQARYELGDYDHANSIRADLTWNASKLALWVKHLKPICNSEAMRIAYPQLPEYLPQLLDDAYGRYISPDELAHYQDPFADSNLDEAKRYELICLAVLSSSEFVAQ